MQVLSYFIRDLTPEVLTVEYSARFQIPGFQILGLPAPEIQEARERIISAFQASELDFPKKRVLINLAPASIRKSGTGHDLAIALRILSGSGALLLDSRVIARGELGLDGLIKPGGKMGHLIELMLKSIPDPEQLTLILGPEDHAEFLRLLSWREKNGLLNPKPARVLRIEHLRDLCASVSSRSSTQRPSLPEPSRPSSMSPPFLLPLAPLQERILKIACVGRHHTLLLGPKGAGKSASLAWFGALAPPPPKGAAWERALYQETRSEHPGFDAPLRQVHSQVRPAHLLGSFHSGSFRAGELSLAHGGMLFADEFPEWPRDSKECLREPLQSECFSVSSVRGTLQAKCDLQLIGSGNLCPCGGLPHRFRLDAVQRGPGCRCSEEEIRKYLHRLSGPILDRIDLWAIFSGPVSPSPSKNTSFEQIENEIRQARSLVEHVHGAPPSRIPPEMIERWIPKSSRAISILNEAGSLRDRHKLIRIACSIAALEGRETPGDRDLLEARTYRRTDAFL